MTNQQFSSRNHAATYVQGRLSPPSELIDTVLDYLREGCKPNENGLWPIAVDVGAGSGQSTFLLKDHFTNILGVDISEAQIDEANKRNQFSNISFKVSPAESIPVENNSVSLVTASQCVHWFDLPKFYQELDRMLVPGGIFAAIFYTAAPIKTTKDAKMTQVLIAEMAEKAFQDLADMGLWDQRAIDVHNRYFTELPLPFKASMKHDFICSIDYTCENYLNYIKSWSSYNKLIDQDPEKAKLFIDNIIEKLKSILGTEDVLPVQIQVDFNFFVAMSRK
ncbi:putative methyltransferase DDB_G0268948 isoform X3 [Tetranychus urticae]|uniref:putative methyltransferase DDB_G0268948 isoform X3 n=1 Tax=Tetranychus urticae TaxID=32264 RepID=UPI000D64EF32|nr:putative methyltransferase DDB_G0268948 isoform X3 [Tetranychus urticae]